MWHYRLQALLANLVRVARWLRNTRGGRVVLGLILFLIVFDLGKDAGLREARWSRPSSIWLDIQELRDAGYEACGADEICVAVVEDCANESHNEFWPYDAYPPAATAMVRTCVKAQAAFQKSEIGQAIQTGVYAGDAIGKYANKIGFVGQLFFLWLVGAVGYLAIVLGLGALRSRTAAALAISVPTLLAVLVFLGKMPI